MSEMQMSLEAYKACLREDMDWLRENAPACLIRGHIEAVLWAELNNAEARLAEYRVRYHEGRRLEPRKFTLDDDDGYEPDPHYSVLP